VAQLRSSVPRGVKVAQLDCEEYWQGPGVKWSTLWNLQHNPVVGTRAPIRNISLFIAASHASFIAAAHETLMLQLK
jgi:hypothetical protein